MKTIGAFEAKTRLSELLERVRQGQTFRILRRGQPVAELRPVSPSGEKPRFGCDKGLVKVSADFDEPLPEMEPYSR